MVSKAKLHKVLDETYKHYYNRRGRCGYDKGRQYCQYLTNDGKMCAVGRMIKKKDLDKLSDDLNFLGGVVEVLENYTDTLFKREYKGLPVHFLTLLQEMHDSYAQTGRLSVMTQMRDSIRKKIDENQFVSPD